MKYTELEYVLPSVDVKAVIEQVIRTLETISKLDGGCLFYVIQPSNILALAGLRAQSPYNEFEPSFSIERRTSLATALKAFGCSIRFEKPDHEEDSNLFSIMSQRAFDEVPQRYRVIQAYWKNLKQFEDSSDFEKWSSEFEASLKVAMEHNILPKQWLLDPEASHNIRFGMLLGYPGQAIASLCWLDVQRKNNTEQQELTATLPFQGLYCGAHVNYVYASELKNNSEINAHQRLWANVLSGVYAIFSEAKLSKLPKFMEEYRKFKQYDELI
jgi:hypothetical protein